MWASIASKNSSIPNVSETPLERFIKTYLRYVYIENVRGDKVKVLLLNHLARKNEPLVLKNPEFMLYALRFDIRNAIQVVDQSLFTVDFICEAYATPIIGLQIFQLLPHYVRSNSALMIGIYKRVGLDQVIRSIPDNLLGDPTFMQELVLIDPSVYRFAHGSARYSFTVLLASILKGSDIDAVEIYEKSRRKEPYLKTMLKFFSENPTVFTMDRALLLCLYNSRELTRKYQSIPEYCSFYTRVRHDITYYNQMCTFQLCVKNAIKHSSGILFKLKQGMFTKILVDKICDYFDAFSYGEEVSMFSLIKIAKHLGIHVALY